MPSLHRSRAAKDPGRMRTSLTALLPSSGASNLRHPSRRRRVAVTAVTVAMMMTRVRVKETSQMQARSPRGLPRQQQVPMGQRRGMTTAVMMMTIARRRRRMMMMTKRRRKRRKRIRRARRRTRTRSRRQQTPGKRRRRRAVMRAVTTRRTQRMTTATTTTATGMAGTTKLRQKRPPRQTGGPRPPRPRPRGCPSPWKTASTPNRTAVARGWVGRRPGPRVRPSSVLRMSTGWGTCKRGWTTTHTRARLARAGTASRPTRSCPRCAGRTSATRRPRKRGAATGAGRYPWRATRSSLTTATTTRDARP